MGCLRIQVILSFSLKFCINITLAIPIFVCISYSPEGKKFRSRNELRTHFLQIGSNLNSEDFDFSVKGKGHHNKGKSPTKKTEAENSKENQVSKKPTTPVVSKRNTPKATITPTERPKRELRKRLRSEPQEEPVKQPEEEEDDDVPEDMDDTEEISNVKLKVKVGYTATGAMIRPSANGARKKKRRFRNMHVKKNKPEKQQSTKPVAKPASSPSKRVSPVVSSSAVTNESAKDALSPRTRQTARNRKGKIAEPVAGPSGLQKVKRSPRRVLKRKGGATSAGEATHDSEEDDDEDLDYVCSLYPNQTHAASPGGTGGQAATEEPQDPLHINEEDMQAANGDVHRTRDSHLSASSNGIDDPHLYTPSAEGDTVGHMVTVDQTVQIEEVEIGDEHMQVVVIGDTVDVHNYAKPHAF